MKVSNRLLYAVLALSVLVNLVSGLPSLLDIVRQQSREKKLASAAAPAPAAKKPSAPPHESLLKQGVIPPERQVKRTEILNTLVEKYGYRSYLEIGQGVRSHNFDWIDCPIKIGVDPDRSLNAAYQMTSDEFFEVNKATFDLIFIDGLHTAEQVEKDVLNALQVLNQNGAIMLHDCCPRTERMQKVPRETGEWTGDVWKAWVKLRATRPDLEMVTVNEDIGCGIIRRGEQQTITLPEPLTYEALDADRKNLLNLVPINDFLTDLRNRDD
jgi:hypothetical protein